MLLAWTLTVAMAAGDPWAGTPGDLEATADVALAPEAVTAVFANPSKALALFGPACVARTWPHTDADAPGVVGTMLWTPSWIHRKLPIVVDEDRPGRRVSWDLQGNRGFFLIVDVKPRDGGATVTVSTPLEPPGWPLRRVFFRKIRPAWASCYAAALLKLDPRAELRTVTGTTPGR